MKKLILVISFLLLCGNTYSQWQSIGPNGGSIYTLTSSGNTIYGLGTSFLFKSTNNGSTWSNNILNISPVPGYDNKLLAKDNYLLLYNMGHLFRSTDGGRNFIPIMQDSVPSITSCFYKGNVAFAATYNNGILKSTNYGLNWINITGNLPIIFYLDIITDGSKIYVCSDTCIAKTTNDGINWTIINNNLPLRNYRKICVSGNNLFVSIENYKIYKTTNDGISWTASGQGLPADNIFDIISNGNTLYAKTDSLDIYKSANNGASWNLFNTGIVKNSYFRFINSGNYTITSTWIRGIYRTTPADNQWNEANSGLSGMHVQNIISVGSKLYASCYENGLYSSLDYGNTWSRVNSLPLDSAVVYVSSIGAYPNHTLFIGFNYSILYSTNDGISWLKSNTPNNYTYMATLSAFYNKPPYLFAGTSNYGVMRSSDNGINWVQSGAGINNSIISCFCEVNGSIYAGTGAGVFMSSNNGTNWINKSSGITGILNIQFLFYDGTRFFASKGSGLYYSTNLGNNWLKLNSKNIWTVTGGISNNVHYLIGNTNDSVWVSFDHGDTWIGKSQNLKPVYFNSLSIFNNYLYGCSSYNSIWRRPLQEVIFVKETSQNIPDKYFLYQNDPNPFNPNTLIKFQIKESGFVTMKVYNILGKEIATLINENLKAGEYETTFNGSGLSSGIYFYRMQIGDFVQTKKMTLLK